MNSSRTTLIAASLLALAGTIVSAQSQTQPAQRDQPRDSRTQDQDRNRPQDQDRNRPQDQDRNRPQDQSRNQDQARNQNQFQNQNQQRNATAVAERMTRTNGKLSSAIEAAERHTSGTAISVRLSTTQQQSGQQNQQRGGQSGNWPYGQQGQQPGTQPRTQPGTQPGQQNQQPGTQPRTQPGTQPGQQDQQPGTQPRTQPGTQPGQQGQQPGTQPRTQPGMQPGQQGQQGQQQWDRGQSGYSADSLFAIVTCVVDRVKVREVIVDMKDNSVVDMQASSSHYRTFGSDSRLQGSGNGLRGMQEGDAQNRQNQSQNQYQNQNSQFARATDLMNATARNAGDERVGDIDELAIDPASNRVVYGVLRRGGFLGMGVSRHAVAVNQLAAPNDGRMLLELNDSHFEGRDGFDNNKWPTQADAAFNSVTHSQGTASATPASVVKASDIIGTKVQCSDRKQMGEIDDLIVELRTGRIAYALIEANDGYIAVPMSAMTKTGETYNVAMTHEQMMAMPKIDSDNDPNWGDTNWSRDLDEKFNTRSGQSGVTGQPGQTGQQDRDRR